MSADLYKKFWPSVGIKQASLLCLGARLLSLLGALSLGKLQFCASVSPSVKWVGVTVAPPPLCCVRIKWNPACEGIELVSGILD